MAGRAGVRGSTARYGSRHHSVLQLPLSVPRTPAWPDLPLGDFAPKPASRSSPRRRFLSLTLGCALHPRRLEGKLEAVEGRNVQSVPWLVAAGSKPTTALSEPRQSTLWHAAVELFRLWRFLLSGSEPFGDGLVGMVDTVDSECRPSAKAVVDWLCWPRPIWLGRMIRGILGRSRLLGVVRRPWRDFTSRGCSHRLGEGKLAAGHEPVAGVCIRRCAIFSNSTPLEPAPRAQNPRGPCRMRPAAAVVGARANTGVGCWAIAAEWAGVTC